MPPTLQTISALVAIALSPAVLVALVKAILYLGRSTQLLETLTKTVESLNTRQGEHGESIAALRTDVDTLKKQNEAPGVVMFGAPPARQA